MSAQTQEQPPLTALYIETTVPEYSNEPTITILGRTKPLATIHAFVNDIRLRVVTTQSSGNFKLLNLPLSPGTNTLKLEAHEGEAVMSKEFTVTYDGTPPVVRLDEEIPQATKANSLTISGEANEKVTISYRVFHRQDRTPPELIAGLKASKVEKNAIELTWEPSSATDLLTYIIERDGTAIATTTVTSFRDENLKSKKPYTYSVAAVDSSCNIGTSAEASATTLSGGENITAITAAAPRLSCEPPYENTTVGSPFSITVPLTEGFNDLEIIFEDDAGNQEVIKQTIIVDNTAPQFVETNLAQTSPSYIPDIKIKGKLNEQATVFVYINDETKPSAFDVSEPDGSFTIKVRLRTDVRIKKGAKQTTVEVGEGWANKIKLEAVDLAGNKAIFGPTDVDFLLCGQGTWWRADIGEALPSVLLPRLMIQGVQQIGIPFTLNYTGNRDVTAAPRVDVRPIPLSKDAEKDYDHNWIQVTDYEGRRTPKSHVGYIQVQFENVDPLPDKPEAGPNEKERALSEHRKGECLVGAFGCVKLFLQVEVQFQEKTTIKPADPRMPAPSPKLENLVQRVCLPVEVAIDQTTPMDIIPRGMLRTTTKTIEKAINLIDKVLKPITTIGEYLLYGCLASNVWLIVSFFQERTACEGSAFASKFTGDGAWNKAIAEAGMCDAAYGSSQGNAQKQLLCKTCEKAIESRKKFETNIMHGLCDRIACPSAPTFSTYIKDKTGDVEPLDIKIDSANKEFAKWAVGNKIYAGNDCAFTYKDFNLITPTYAGEGQRRGIRELYDITKGTKTVQGPSPEDCKKTLHPAHPNCCGVQYQKDWSSACGPGTAIADSLDFFDELKQSTCLSAQQANADASDLQCNNLWNSVAGFCEGKTGQPSAQTVNAEAQWTPAKPGADDNAVYLFVIPAGFEAGRDLPRPSVAALGGGGTATSYRVFRGYAIKTPQFEQQVKTDNTAESRRKNSFRLSASMTAELEQDVTNCFGQQPAAKAEKTTRMTDAQQRECLYTGLNDGKTSSIEKGPQLNNIYDKVNEIVGVPDQQYIVRPNSGLFRSIQCVCIPAVTSYLQMWRSVLGAFHGCFSKILMTGEGSEGFCAAKFSGTICDLFFEAVSCFAEKFNAPGVGARPGIGGFGDVLGAITGAGADVSKSVNQRYGETSLYKSLFSERKLVHAVCVWAFTGTWDLDVSGIFQQQVADIPVDTEGALTTCQRTFVSYDPTTNPAGLTTWAYRIAGGMIAGSDIRYRLKLKCNSGFTCDPTDYPDGKCDCTAKEQEITVSNPALGRGQAKKFELVNFDAPFVVSAQSSPDSDVRYDTAILEWDWTDSQTKQVRTDKVDCSIRETEGGNAPAFCALDVFSGKYRCMFGEMEAGIRMSTPKTAYPQGQDAFALTQPLGFSIDIRQKYPEQERRKQLQSRKFLVYDIRDAAGTTIKSAGQELKITPEATSLQYALETNGAYVFAVPQPADPTPILNFRLTPEIIQRHAVKAVAAKPTQQYWGISTNKQFVNALTLVDGAGNRYEGTRYFVINFPNYRADPLSYDVWAVPGAQKPAPKPNNGWADSMTLKVYSGKQLEGNLMNRVSFPIKDTAGKDYTATLEFESVTGFQNINAIQVLMTYAYTAQEAAKTDVCKTKEAIPWTAVFTIYDADRQGNPSEQPSTDPDSGKQQQESVTFNVKCATADEVKAATTLIAAQIPAGPAPAELKAQLENLLLDIIDKSKKINTELVAAAVGAGSKGAQLLAEIITRETEAKNAHATLSAKIPDLETLNKNLQATWDSELKLLQESAKDIVSASTDIATTARDRAVSTLNRLIKAQQAEANELTLQTYSPSLPLELCRSAGGKCKRPSDCTERAGGRLDCLQDEICCVPASQ